MEYISFQYMDLKSEEVSQLVCLRVGGITTKLERKLNKKLTTGIFCILRARLAYLRVFRLSSILISAGLIQAGKSVDINIMSKE